MSKKKFDKKPILGNSLLKNLIAITICGIALILLVMLFLHVYTRHGQNVVVPDLEGLQVEEANVILTAKGIHAEIVDSIYRDDAIPGAILSQVPKPNNGQGRPLHLRNSLLKEPKEVAVPGWSIIPFAATAL